MVTWNRNVDTTCIFCQNLMESREHLFFLCPYSLKVWEDLMKGFLIDKFTANWREILKLTTETDHDNMKAFILKYVFQNTIHYAWRERNDRRHGEQPSSMEKLVKMIDKNIRNRLSKFFSSGDSRYETGLQLWFASRQHQG
ncbi:hypothetical protein V5N11_010415 [Cardamine amara subsp. amara]|uniref:Reverse transcriptase zinc-binding domain-containing protein n=1 Tax=Cardamine amara subsp. amara TaxID=228776 RepID=A0ABD0ZIM7_CARAN